MNTNSYQLKHYRNWSYLKTINPDIIKSNISFVSNQNGGQGQMRLEINEPFIDNDYTYNDIIKVYAFNEYSKVWKLIYTWFIQEITQKATNNETLELWLIWVVWLLSGLIYRSWWSMKFSKNDTPVNILTEILISFNTLSNIDITLWDTISTPTSINIEFDHTTCFEAIKRVMEFVDWYWYVDQNQKLHIRQHELKHKFTYRKDIQNMDIRGDIGIYNRLHLFYNGADKEYNDTTSQTLYWIREKKVTDTTIKNLSSADQFATEWLSQNAYPQKKTKLTVTDQFVNISEIIWNDLWIRDWTWLRNDDYTWKDYWAIWSTETIEPWDWIRVNNFYEVVTGNIDRLNYNNWFISIDLDKSENFIKLIKE